MVMGLYILFTIISPFMDTSKFNVDNITTEYFDVKTKATTSSIEVDQTSMDTRIKQLYQEQLEMDIKVKLKTKGYEVEKCSVIANIKSEDSGIEKIVIKIKEKINENEDKKEKNESKNSVENVLVKEIQKVKIGNNKEEKQEDDENSKITKIDINIIKNFLIEEYGVSENCLKIS
jgi:hypothetical protein